ncbi:uncharacterized protein [Rutidosis leptorrhynchoides]|uniref:uncharacterized protein n=1 Tax=Rutidosis leptorrhynchoides TaxID=125765 RepID=UPI003A9A48A5
MGKNYHEYLWVGGGLDTNFSCMNIPGRTIWKEIIKAGKMADDTGASFSSSFSKKLGNGNTILFWDEIWCGSERLGDTFHRLYMLESNKDATVADRIINVNSTSTSNWCWVRPPRGRALNEILELNNLISSVTLTDQSDSWKFNLDSTGIYTTKTLSQIINNLKLGIHASAILIQRNKFTPQKVNFFAWRVIQRKIPIRVELDKRGIDLDTILCPLCDTDTETIDHTFVTCPKTSQIRELILTWWSQAITSITNLGDVIINNQSFTSNNIGSSLWQATKWIVCYIIWKHRNLKVLLKKEWSPATIVSEIQTQSYSWISKRSKKKKPIEWQQWLINPSSYVVTSSHRVGVG